MCKGEHNRISVLHFLASPSVVVLQASRTFWSSKLLILPTILYVQVGWNGFECTWGFPFGVSLTSDFSCLGSFAIAFEDLLFSENLFVPFGMSWKNAVREESKLCLVVFPCSPIKRKYTVLDTFASPCILVYTVKRPARLLISMIGGVCQLPTVLRQHLSRTVIWRLLSFVDVPYFNDQTSHVSYVGQAPSSLTAAVVRSFVLRRDLSFFAWRYEIHQPLSGQWIWTSYPRLSWVDNSS